MLTNANSGQELHGRALDAALKEFLGIEAVEPRLVSLTAAQLAEYAAVYEATLNAHEVTVGDGGLMLQTRPAGPSPLSDGQLAPPLPPPARLGFFERDAVVALDGPQKGAKGEFLRNPDGAIAWFRWGGRIGRRQA